MEAGHSLILKPLNNVRVRLTILKPLFFTENRDTVFTTARLEFKKGGA